MKKKVILLLVIFLMVTCYFDLFQMNTAKASEIPAQPTVTVTPSAALSNISIVQNPTKMTYYQGESLDLSGIILQANYSDGTTGNITQYQASGFNSNQLGNQTVLLSYQGLNTTLTVMVLPPKITNLSVSSYSTSSVTLTWDAISGAVKYEIYSFDPVSLTYTLLCDSPVNSVTMEYPAATVKNIKVCAVVNTDGTEYKGELSDTVIAATAPEAVTGLTVTGTSASTIALSWDAVPGATGYIVYRSKASANNFSVCKVTDSAVYTDKKLTSGTAYQYKVCAYTYDQTFLGEVSEITVTSTNAATMVLKLKTGEGKIRVTWSKVTGVSAYDIYIGDDENGYALAVSRKSTYTCTYTIEGLDTGCSYSVYAIARRTYKGTAYDSDPSTENTVEITEIAPTNTDAKFFTTKKAFANSAAYKNITFFRKYLNYSKSYIIPGLITTNVGGFSSNTMCPQAIAFAGSYLLQTAYDTAAEENSVIYVIDKASKGLVTTLVLPSKAHVGGITFDGMNIWVTRGTSLSSFPFSQVLEAVSSGAAYYTVKFNTTMEVGLTASYVTYYNDRIWVGSYNELETTKMYSFTIDSKDTVPELTKSETVKMPTRVQGIAFTGDGTLIMSRSCQLYAGLRGYMRQLDLYQPTYSEDTGNLVSLGSVVNTVEMPSMNEGIAINGSYLYVLYESAAFEKASYQMDRICAFKLTSLFKVVKSA